MTKTLENTYDTYSPMLYGIAVNYSSSLNKADEILICTFQKLYGLQTTEQRQPSLCITLIKLTIQTAYERNPATNTGYEYKKKKFEQIPMLYNLLCKKTSLHDLCKENNLTRMDAVTQMKQEINSLQSYKQEEQV